MVFLKGDILVINHAQQRDPIFGMVAPKNIF